MTAHTVEHSTLSQHWTWSHARAHVVQGPGWLGGGSTCGAALAGWEGAAHVVQGPGWLGGGSTCGAALAGWEGAAHVVQGPGWLGGGSSSWHVVSNDNNKYDDNTHANKLET